MNVSMVGADLAVVIDRAARDVAYESGLSAVTLRRVAIRAGLAPSVVALQEPSMTALAARMFHLIASSELNDVIRRASRFPSSMGALWFVADEVTSKSHGGEDWVWADAWAGASRNTALATAARDVTAAWTVFVSGLIQAAVAAGECVPVDADLVAAAFVALIDGSSAHPVIDVSAPACRAAMVKSFLMSALRLPAVAA